jgi:alpha-L-fucosidase
MAIEFPRRQIHLDFHTPGDTPDVGAHFDGAAFASTFAQAHVESVNIFAKCHHGYSYYPTSVGTVHPGLGRDLLGEQIEALHAAGIRAPIYVSIGWDDLAGQLHPEWIITTREGQTLMRPPLSDHSPLQEQVGWSWMDAASGYGDYVCDQVRELCEKYDVDGFWFDIVGVLPNYATWSQAKMREAGVDISDDAAVRRYAGARLTEFLDRLSSLIRQYVPEASIFYNGTTGPNSAGTLPFQTQLEVESLPTGAESQWGYLHYPITARFARSLDVPIVGMTGRFHKSWADFGGLKTREQLDYECGTIVSAGGAVSIGDQLDAGGVLDAAVYRTIGHSFEHIAELEPWLQGATRVSEVGILAGQRHEGLLNFAEFSDGVNGAAQVMLELGIQFDVVDPASFAVDRYQVIIIPDGFVPTDAALARIESARRAGAKIVLSGLTAFDEDAGEFLIPGIPVNVVEPAPTIPSYIRGSVSAEVSQEFADDYDYAFYDQAYVVLPTGDAKPLGTLKRARYTRTWEHFYGHAQAPVGESLNSPWGVLSDDVLYLAAPLFLGYLKHDYWVYRALLEDAFRELIPSRAVTFGGPAWVEVGLSTQDESEQHPARSVAHLTAYSARRTSNSVARVDEGAWVGAGLSLTLATATPVTRAYLAPSGPELVFTQGDGSVSVLLPALGTHSVVVVE